MSQLFYEDVETGATLPVLTNPPVNHNQLVRYAGASGDFNPLHTDPAVGQSLGLGGPIAHGMLIMGCLGHLLSDYLGGPGALRRFGVRFQGMTRHEDEISCSGTITNKYSDGGRYYIEGQVRAADQRGDVKASGTFLAELPSRGAN